MEEINKLIRERNDLFMYYNNHNNLSLDTLMIANDELAELDKRIETLSILLKA
jgi:hypothetical protein